MSITNEPATVGLTKYVRFRDLKRAGIVANWPTLRHYITAYDFPPGVRLSNNVRAWVLDEVNSWCANRPVEPKTVSTRNRRREAA